MKPEQAITGGEKTVKMVIEKNSFYDPFGYFCMRGKRTLQFFSTVTHLSEKNPFLKTEHVFGSLDIYQKLVKLGLS